MTLRAHFKLMIFFKGSQQKVAFLLKEVFMDAKKSFEIDKANFIKILESVNYGETTGIVVSVTVLHKDHEVIDFQGGVAGNHTANCLAMATLLIELSKGMEVPMNEAPEAILRRQRTW